MTSIIRKFCAFTAILLFGATVYADFIPKKTFEIDLKKLTGRDVKDISPNGNIYQNIRRIGVDYRVIWVQYTDREILGPITNYEDDYYIILADSNGGYEVIENVNSKSTYYGKCRLHYYTYQWQEKEEGNYDLILYYSKQYTRNRKSSEVDKGENKTEVYRTRVSFEEGITITEKEKHVFKEYDDVNGDQFRKGNIVQQYDFTSWVESEGGNSEPQIRFSRIGPNEIIIEGETTKGGTIERSTDLKNWRKLVKVNKGGFEVFVDPTEKNKEFFRVKSE